MATKRGKRYKEAESLIEQGRNYAPDDAVALIKRTATAKFDETVEVHLRTGADPRHADQMVRGVAQLPHGVGKAIRVMVFTSGEAVSIADGAGADYIADDEIIKSIEGGWSDFDVSIATPEVMGRIGRLGRHLGRKGAYAQPQNGHRGSRPKTCPGRLPTLRRAGWSTASTARRSSTPQSARPASKRNSSWITSPPSWTP